MGRILSIDYGSKRTGLAVTDPLRIIANGLATVPTHELFDFLRQYMRQEQVDEVVIGRPTQPNGKPSENLRRVESGAGAKPCPRSPSRSSTSASPPSLPTRPSSMEA